MAGGIREIDTGNFTPANLVRAFANGIAGELATGARTIPATDLQRLAEIGSAAQRNPMLVKTLERQFGLPCRIIASGGEAALGVSRLVARLARGHETHAMSGERGATSAAPSIGRCMCR